jgi:hypothetical protein
MPAARDQEPHLISIRTVGAALSGRSSRAKEGRFAGIRGSILERAGNDWRPLPRFVADKAMRWNCSAIFLVHQLDCNISTRL